jgi:uncharacterized alpha-E superfamily protein
MSETILPLPTAQKPISDRRDSHVMLSRVANSLYWMSRYIERSENVARLLDVNLQLMLDFADLNDQQLKEHWLPILCSAGDEETFFKLYERADSESVTEFLTFREENPNSIISCLFTARENARQVRDQISLEMFETLNECYLFLKSRNAREVWQSGAHEFYEQIKRYSHLFQGLTGSTFTRNEGYEFINLGKFLERADKTTRILDIKYHILLPSVADVGGAVDAAQWQAILRSASALEAYRRFHVEDILPKKVAEFLIFSTTFPRSIRSCMEHLDNDLHRLSGKEKREYKSAEERAFGKLLSDLNFLTIDDILNEGLHEFLQKIQTTLDRLDDHIYQEYMYHPPVDIQAEILLHQQQMQQQQ